MVDVFLEAALNFFLHIPIQYSLNNLNFRSMQSTRLVITIDVKLQ